MKLNLPHQISEAKEEASFLFIFITLETRWLRPLW